MTPRKRPRDLVGGEWPGSPQDADPDVAYLQRAVARLTEATAGVSTRAIARQAELGHVTVKRILEGETWPDSYSLAKLERAFGPLWVSDVADPIPTVMRSALDPTVRRALSALALVCEQPRFAFHPELSADTPGERLPSLAVDLVDLGAGIAVHCADVGGDSAESTPDGMYRAVGRLWSFADHTSEQLALAILVADDLGPYWARWAHNRRVALLYCRDHAVISTDPQFPRLPGARDAPIGPDYAVAAKHRRDHVVVTLLDPTLATGNPEQPDAIRRAPSPVRR